MRRRVEGRFVVAGPGADKALPSDRAALSCAQYFACRHPEDADWTVSVIGEQRPLWVVSRRGKCVTWVAG